MLVIAHRGSHLRHPENTLLAFEAAVAEGADGIETDVRVSSDGVLVLHHDRTLADGRAVADLTHAELSAARGYPVPSLEDALTSFDVLWDIEIKVIAAVAPTCKLLSRFQATRRCFVTSFWHPIVQQLGVRMEFDRGVLIAHAPFNPDAVVQQVHACGATKLVVDFETLSPDLVAAATRGSIEVYAYDVRSQAEAGRCKALGLMGVITDFVGDILAVK